MALSNWDTLAFDSDGQSSNGIIEGFDGQQAEIYKNWLYVRDSKMWVKNREFIKPTIAEIFEGEVRISKFRIKAVRGSQNSIFVYAETYKVVKKSDKKSEFVYRRMAGIGSYGYDDPSQRMADYFKIKLEDYDDFWDSYVCGKGKVYNCLTLIKDGKRSEFRVGETEENKEYFSSQWVGVTRETYNEFIFWLNSFAKNEGEKFELWLKKIKETTPIRVNQGDMFFEDNLDISLGGTEIEKASSPFFMQVIDKIKPTVNKGGKPGCK